MKPGKLIRFINLSILAALLAITTNVIPIEKQTAFAAGYITVSPNEGLPGTQIHMNGSGFVSNVDLKLYFSADPANIGNEIDQHVTRYANVSVVKTDYSAGFTNTVFAVPAMLNDGKNKVNVTNGDYFIYITYSNSKQIQAKANFFVPGRVTLNPNKGRIGDFISITATGLKANELITLYFSSNKAQVGSIIDKNITAYQKIGLYPTKADGTFGEYIVFKIPSSLSDGPITEDVHGGDYYVYITYAATRTRVETISRYTVLDGEIILDPFAGYVGSEIKITGKGLRAKQSITVNFEGDLVTITKGDTATDADGGFNCSIVVPDSVTGSHQIVVYDVTGNRPEAWFTVTPSIKLPDIAIAGSEIPIQGYGFSETQFINVRINDQLLSTNPPDLKTNRKGTFSGSFKSPGLTGEIKVVVTDALMRTAQSEIKIVPPPASQAKLSLFPETNKGNPGYVGMQLTISGTAFQRNGFVNITYENDTPLIFKNIATNAEGMFQTTIDIPKGKAGNHIIEATDGNNTALAIFIMEDTAPQPPVAQIPEVVSGVKPTTKFDWTDVEDTSGVSYSFQVATDTTFNRIVLQKDYLTKSEYQLKDNEALELRGRQTSYYWRVKAVDGARNESTWSNPILFYVGSATSAFPSWAIFVLVALALVVILIVAIFIIRLRKNRPKQY